ncbi:hypothetical protein C5167_037434 [Papaver somniferum]|uniref:Cysteine-rich transmembrane CYSTM domain-containing protein n=1 Tax=Papaver somniferum TaxID=3469 RepID=A0A4Y7IAQ7_PAPSO|nr:cysteine-rich and transmembrane domain-containing protein WIH1-like [Papaver somniferum]RZC44489.1 hypothetical protein C5167_037434 [Papaver somniferum]
MAQSQAAYPPQSCPPAPAVEGYPPPGAFAAPPPPGYPGAEYAGQQQSQAPGATTDRGASPEGCLALKECICWCTEQLGSCS